MLQSVSFKEPFLDFWHRHVQERQQVAEEVLSYCSFLTREELARRVKKVFSFKPADIIVKNLIFSASTNYGHFGKADLPWEKLDPKKLDKLKS